MRCNYMMNSILIHDKNSVKKKILKKAVLQLILQKINIVLSSIIVT